MYKRIEHSLDTEHKIRTFHPTPGINISWEPGRKYATLSGPGMDNDSICEDCEKRMGKKRDMPPFFDKDPTVIKHNIRHG